MPLFDLQLAPDDIQLTEIPFGEWRPDLPNLNNPGGLEALNVIPADGGYRPFPQLLLEGGATLADPIRGAAAVLQSSNVVQLYAATVHGIFTRFGGGAYSSVYSADTGDNNTWKFIRVNEQMVAIHAEKPPVKTPVGTTTAATVLGGSPPTAAAGAQVGDFLMLGNLLVDPDDGGNPFPSRVRWSGFNNIDSPWVSSPITQADYQDMPPEGGAVIAITGRERGTIFQERMINVARYTGPKQIFDIQVAEDKRGCIARDCVVDVGAFQFFIAEDGFFVWNGVNSTPIGDNAVNRYFFKRLNWGRRTRVVGAHDPVNGCVVWAFPTATGGELDELIIYSYRDNQWAHSIQTIEYLLTSASSNVTLDELTDPLDSYTTSFDSPIYMQGGRERLAAFDTTHTYGLYLGAPMAATFETAEYTGPDGRRAFINNVRPIVDVTSPLCTVQIATRDQGIGQTLVYGTAVAQEVDGNCPVIVDGRYVRIRVNIPADTIWEHATGVDVSRKATGVF